MLRQVNSLLNLTESTIVSLDLGGAPLGEEIMVNIPIEGMNLLVELHPQSVRAANYRIQKQIQDGSYVDVEPGPDRSMRGAIAGFPDSIVAMSMMDEGLYGTIRVPGMGVYWVEPIFGRIAGATPDQHVVYSNEAVLGNGGTCGLEGVVDPPNGGGAGAEGGIAGGPCALNHVTELACDADVEYFQDWSSSVSVVEARINNVINTMNGQYEDEVQITHEITHIIVRTAEPDPYSSSGASTLLSQFRGHWEGQQDHIQRDVAQLFTGRNLSGSTIGIAFTIGGICNSSAYCLVQSDCCGSFACVTDLSAHELGHLWDANHCTCSGPGTASDFTMNPTILCANKFHPTFTIPEIISYRNSVSGCLDCQGAGPGPANNNCSAAMAIQDGTFAFDTTDATTDGPSVSTCTAFGDNQIASDIWFRYQATCTGMATASLCGSSYNTKMAVYTTACPSGSSTQLACNDDFDCDGDGAIEPNEETSAVSWQVIANTRYLIRVGGFFGEEGQGTLNVACESFEPPANDLCENATVVSTGTHDFTTLGSTSGGPTLPDTCDEGLGVNFQSDVWHEFQANCAGTLTVRTCNFADYDTRLAVYRGSDCGTMELVGCNDDLESCSGLTSFLQVLGVQCGEIYKIRVGSRSGFQGTGSVIIGCAPVGSCPDVTCAADLSGDGQVNGIDLGTLLAGWSIPAGSPGCGGASPCAADINTDGVVDGIDLGTLLAAWGPCD